MTVVGAQKIESLALTNVGDVLNRMPSFRATQTPATSFVSLNGSLGARTLDLRGLGASRTLVLVNGHRFIPSSSQGTVDVNLIPTMLIDRVEVVTGGASAAYGSDAVAGVVNIILNDKLTGVRGQVSYGQTDRGDGEETQFGLAGGSSFLGGRGHVVLGGEYADNKGTGNCYTRVWCSLEYANINNPNRLTNGLPALIQLPHNHGATFTPGGIINAGPLRGTAFRADGTPYQYQYGFLPGAIFQQGGDGHGVNPFSSAPLLSIPVERYALYSRATLDVGHGVEAFADISYGRVRASSNGAQGRDTALVIQRDNPYLPESIRQAMVAGNLASLTFGRQGDDFGVAVNHGDNRTVRVAAGLKGSLVAGWTWDAYYQHGDNKYRQRVTNNRDQARYTLAIDAVRAPNGAIVCRSTLTSPTNGCAPMNLFGENRFSAESKAYVSGTASQDTDIKQDVVAFNVQGDLFKLPDGAVSIAAGLEYRKDSIDGVADPISQANGWYVGNGQSVSGEITAKEGYVEFVAPLLRDRPMAKTLELNGAVRVTDYSTSGTVKTWKIGAVYQPIDEVRLRVTRSRDIRAPNVNELFGATSAAFTRITDPLTGSNGLPRVFTGGNRQLVPEIADTFTLGVVLQPKGFLDRLRLSVDYFDIQLEDAITTVGAQTIVDRCAQGNATFCTLVTRDAARQILEIRNPGLNLNALITRGVDFEADYGLDIGRYGGLRFGLLATYVADLITTDSIGPTDRAGQTGVQTGATPGLPKWTVNGNVTWNLSAFSLTAEGRYIPKGTYDVTLVGPQDSGYSNLLPNSISNNRVSSRFYLNLSGSYAIVRRDSRKLELFAAVYNLTDLDPPIAPANAVGVNSILFDTLGRSYRAGIRFVY